MSSKKRAELIRIAVSALCFAVLLTLEHLGVFDGLGELGAWLKLLLYLALYVCVGGAILVKAVKSALHGHVFGENMLMSIATVCAFFIGEYHEAVAVMLFYLVGEWFQGYAVGKTRDSVTDLMRLREDKARVITDGVEVIVNPRKVKIGEVIVVYPGERIPLDGRVALGSSALDVSSLTGEAIPCEVSEGDEVMSGSVNLATTLQITVTKTQRNSTAARILALVSSAGDRKSHVETFITRFARWYTPAVVVMAVLLFSVGGLISGNFAEWGYRALNFLVVSCPCALVVSVPLAFFAGIGRAGREGVLVKGAVYMEALARARTVVMDKTGTLTEGKFRVTSVLPEERRTEVLRLAAIAEKDSSHPIATSIISEWGAEVDEGYTLTNVGGMGVVAEGERTVLCGSSRLMEKYGISVPEANAKCVVYVAVDGEYFGTIALSDRVKSDAGKVVKQFNDNGIATVMLTGDSADNALPVAEELGISKVISGLLPDQKLSALEQIIEQKQAGTSVCFVGDGINDAPSLIRADVGISMGGIGSDAAIEASDVVVMRDELTKLPFAIGTARRTMGVVRQNVVFSLSVKAVALVLSALGLTGLWFSVFADVGVAVLAILNSTRLLKGEKKLENR